MKTTFAISRPKPRNPLVVAARFRRAGAHKRDAHGERQRANRTLRAELDRLRPSSP